MRGIERDSFEEEREWKKKKKKNETHKEMRPIETNNSLF
jgi:hypothetical protein